MSGGGASAWARQAWRAVCWAPVAATVNTCVVGVARADGASMRPALEGGGDGDSTTPDLVLLTRWQARYGGLERGDVVLLRRPDEPTQTTLKRLIGLDGDWVAVPERGDGHIERIPKGSCWVEGDDACHRDAACSASAFGAVPLALVEGVAAYVLWPPQRAGPVVSKLPPGRLLLRGAASEETVV